MPTVTTMPVPPQESCGLSAARGAAGAGFRFTKTEATVTKTGRTTATGSVMAATTAAHRTAEGWCDRITDVAVGCAQALRAGGRVFEGRTCLANVSVERVGAVLCDVVEAVLAAKTVFTRV